MLVKNKPVMIPTTQQLQEYVKIQEPTALAPIETLEPEEIKFRFYAGIVVFEPIPKSLISENLYSGGFIDTSLSDSNSPLDFSAWGLVIGHGLGYYVLNEKTGLYVKYVPITVRVGDIILYHKDRNGIMDLYGHQLNYVHEKNVWGYIPKAETMDYLFNIHNNPIPEQVTDIDATILVN